MLLHPPLTVPEENLDGSSIAARDRKINMLILIDVPCSYGPRVLTNLNQHA
jgi:hypothetical protein